MPPGVAREGRHQRRLDGPGRRVVQQAVDIVSVQAGPQLGVLWGDGGGPGRHGGRPLPGRKDGERREQGPPAQADTFDLPVVGFEFVDVTQQRLLVGAWRTRGEGRPHRPERQATFGGGRLVGRRRGRVQVQQPPLRGAVGGLGGDGPDGGGDWDVVEHAAVDRGTAR